MIRIITETTFGYWNGTCVEPKTKHSPPFSLNAEREAELVLQGVAEFVETEEEGRTGIETTETTEAEEAEAVTLNEFTIEELQTMKLEQLKKIAGQLGVKYEAGMKKADLAQSICISTHTAQRETDPIDFDPAQAIV